MDDIDFVIIWVDGNDPNWQKEYEHYSQFLGGDKRIIRFRDWENLKYWFRGVEKFAPWVRKIHFVTCGHYPKWLNLDAPKLHFVKHSDYIPQEYLPTFNSHTIELNLHRIEGLAEKFVYFNDDCFLIGNVSPERFFYHDLPCDMAVMNAISTSEIGHILLSCIQEMNGLFSKRATMKKHLWKWYNWKYGSWNLRTLALMPWRSFTGFYDFHLPPSFCKKTFEDVWQENPSLLHKTCLSRFRENSNISQYLMRYRQLVLGEFYPYNVAKDSVYTTMSSSNIESICHIITKSKKSILVLSEDENICFEYAKQKINEAFENILPNKSAFEL